MLVRTSQLRNFKLLAQDGDIGHAKDFLFDDEEWTVRYMVANTGSWLLGKQVLISPRFLSSPKLDDERMPLSISRQDVEQAPSIAEDQPVSRQYEQAYADYFSHGYYWLGGGVWGLGATPYESQPMETDKADEADETEGDDEHLRSVAAVTDYAVSATDEQVGYVDDFVIDTDTWRVVLVGIDTRKWLPGKRFMLPVAWIDEISWLEKRMTVDVSAQQLKSAPELKADTISAADVARLFDHFGRRAQAS